MDIALVTGADRGIGLQIARELIGIGFRVYGLAADFSKCAWDHHDFMRVNCDLANVGHLRQAWEHIEKHDPAVSAVVHAAPAAELPLGFEQSAWEDVAHSVQSGLLAPLLLTRWALPSLVRQRGHVINVGWNGSASAMPSPLEAAAQGGLYHWSQSLFNELRDTGVKVCTVYPQANPGEDAKARLRVDPQSAVDARLVAQAVVQVFQFRQNNLITELVVRPQATREQPRLAPSVEPLLRGPKDIVLPDPDKRPPAPEPIPTPERHRPDDAWDLDEDWDEDDFDEDEDDELDAMLESSRRLLAQQNEAARRQLENTRRKGNERARGREPRREHDGRENRRDSAPRAEADRPRGEPAKGSTNTPAGKEPDDSRNEPARREANGDSEVKAASAALQAGGDTADEGRRRRRRRGGRGRNRNRGQDVQPQGQGNGERGRLDGRGANDERGSDTKRTEGQHERRSGNERSGGSESGVGRSGAEGMHRRGASDNGERRQQERGGHPIEREAARQRVPVESRVQPAASNNRGEAAAARTVGGERQSAAAGESRREPSPVVAVARDTAAAAKPQQSAAKATAASAEVVGARLGSASDSPAKKVSTRKRVSAVKKTVEKVVEKASASATAAAPAVPPAAERGAAKKVAAKAKVEASSSVSASASAPASASATAQAPRAERVATEPAADKVAKKKAAVKKAAVKTAKKAATKKAAAKKIASSKAASAE